MKALNAGDLIGERYKVIRPLRGSGLGGIYLASHIDFPDRIVAMKVIHVSETEDVELTEARCRNEVVATYNIDHPNVVETYDYLREGDIIAITMEYIRGGDVADLLAKKEALSVGQTLDLLAQILSGLQAIHHAGIVHRDLKPENIMLTEDGSVKISDFGTARMGKETLSKGDGITGTLAYLSPEYLKNGSLDQRSDIYSLGVLIYEMVTGKTPFFGCSAMELLTKKLTSMPTPPEEVNPNCTAELGAIAMKALSHNPDDRYASAKEMMDAIRKVPIPQAHTSAETEFPEPDPFFANEPNSSVFSETGTLVSQTVPGMPKPETVEPATGLNPVTDLFGSPDLPDSRDSATTEPAKDVRSMLDQINARDADTGFPTFNERFSTPEENPTGLDRPVSPRPNDFPSDFLDDYPSTLNIPKKSGPKPALIMAVVIVVGLVVISPLVMSGDGEATGTGGDYNKAGSPKQSAHLKEVTNIRLNQISRALKKNKEKDSVINSITREASQPRALSPTTGISQTPSNSSSIKPRWYVLFGKTDDPNNAQIVADRLINSGFLAKTRKIGRATAITYEVIIGPYDDKESAILNMKAVEKSGIGGTSLKIVRIRE